MLDRAFLSAGGPHFRALLTALLAVASLVGCSDSFSDCTATKTCLSQGDASVHADAGLLGAGGSSSGAGGRGGSAGGTTASGGQSMSGGAGTSGTSGGAGASGATGTIGGGSDAGPEAGSDGGVHCPRGFADCNGRPDDGCEVELAKDKDHCGKCETACAASGTTANTCDDGVCKAVCDTDYVDCNADGSDGCEIDVKTDPDHCGACRAPCAADGTTSRACVAGVCTPKCDTTHFDCNKDGKDGCEVDLQGDPDHCGACGTACSAAGTSARACVAGVCTPMCDGTHGNCDSDGKNGCETDLQVTPDHCGACTVACAMTNVKARSCVAGTCAPVCNTGYADCSPSAPKPDDGCETNLDVPASCGACGHSCLGGACSGQKCNAFALASSLTTPHGIAVDANYVHWCDGGPSSGRFMRVSVNGGNPTTISGHEINPTDTISDGQNVYWTDSGNGNNGAVRKVASGSSTITNLVTASTNPSAASGPGRMAMGASTIYWTNGTDPSGSYRISKSGGNVVAIGELQSAANAIAVDSQYVYTAFLDLYRTSIDGSGTPLHYTVGGALSLALDGDYVYYPLQDTSSGNVNLYRIAKDFSGTGSLVVPTNLSPGSPIVVDSTYLYFSDGTALDRVPKTGGTPQPLSDVVNAVYAIVVTDDAVYWSNTGDGSLDGSVMKLAL